MPGNEKIYEILELAVNEYKKLEERLYSNNQPESQPKNIEHIEKIYRVFSLALRRINASEPDLYWRAPNLDYFILLRQYTLLNDKNNTKDLLQKIHHELGLDGRYGFYEELKKVQKKEKSNKIIYLNPMRDMKEYKPLTEKLEEIKRKQKIKQIRKEHKKHKKPEEHEEQPTEANNTSIDELVKAA